MAVAEDAAALVGVGAMAVQARTAPLEAEAVSVGTAEPERVDLAASRTEVGLASTVD